MQYYEEQEARQTLSKLDGYDPSYDIEYFNSWSTYEEYGWLAILKLNDKFYLVSGGYCVMGQIGDGFYPDEFTEDAAIQEMIDFDEAVRQMEIAMGAMS